jgi:hypothetical protein
MTNNKDLNTISNRVNKIIGVAVGVALLLLVGSWAEELPLYKYDESNEKSSDRQPSRQKDSVGLGLAGNKSFNRDFGIGLRYNYFTPELNIKSDSLKPYYEAKYTSIVSSSYVAEYSALERNKTSLPGYALDFKLSSSPSWQFVFSYETFDDIRADIYGAGVFTIPNNGFSDSDVITLENIRLITLGANYIMRLYPTGRRSVLAIHTPAETYYKIGKEPPLPSIKLNLGLGLQQISYKATDEWTTSVINITTKTTINSFTDSISEIKPAFWFDLDIYPVDRFSITLSGRYLDLSSEANWGGEKASIIFNGLSFGLGARIHF